MAKRATFKEIKLNMNNCHVLIMQLDDFEESDGVTSEGKEDIFLFILIKKMISSAGSPAEVLEI